MLVLVTSFCCESLLRIFFPVFREKKNRRFEHAHASHPASTLSSSTLFQKQISRTRIFLGLQNLVIQNFPELDK